MIKQKFIPKQFVTSPDFKRGTMGQDLATNVPEIAGQVTGTDVRNAIASYSKTAHFSFNPACKFLTIFCNRHSIIAQIYPRPLLRTQRQRSQHGPKAPNSASYAHYEDESFQLWKGGR